MREIKFRAWDKNLKKFIDPNEGITFNSDKPSEGYAALTLDGNLRVFSAWHMGPSKEDSEDDECLIGVSHSEYTSEHPLDHDYQPQYVLMQYTGLKDKNGKDIYEGDVVKHDSLSNLYGNGKDYLIVVHDIRELDDLWPVYDEEPGDVINDGIEVVGNIYESPGLLGGTPENHELLERNEEK